MQVACPRCGTRVQRPAYGDPVCPTCGFGGPVPNAPPQYAPPQYFSPRASQPTSGLAVAALASGLAAWLLGWIPFIGWSLAPIALILAIVFGAIALKAIKRSGGVIQGRGMAMTGLILGIVGIALAVLIVGAAVVFVLVSDLGGDTPPPQFVANAEEADRPGAISIQLLSARDCMVVDEFTWLLDGSPVPASEPSAAPGGTTRAQTWCVGDKVYITGTDGASHSLRIIHTETDEIVFGRTVQL